MLIINILLLSMKEQITDFLKSTQRKSHCFGSEPIMLVCEQCKLLNLKNMNETIHTK